MSRRAIACVAFATTLALAGLAAPPVLAGSSWQAVSSPNVAGSNYDELDASVVTNSSQAWAAGFSRVGANPFRALLEQWNGSTWAIAPTAPISASDDTRFHALASTSTSDVWVVGEDTTAVGAQHGLIEHWNGSSWTRAAGAAGEPSTSILEAVNADSPKDAWAVGWSRPADSYQPLIEHWNGISWSVVSGAAAYPPSSYNRLTAVSALAPNNVWVLGVTNRHPDPVIEHWNGSSWSIVPQPANGYDAVLEGISANSASDIWAVGGQNVTDALIEHWNGVQWAIVTNPAVGGSGVNRLLSSVKALGPNDVWAVGQSLKNGSQLSPLTLHWDGTRWTTASAPGTQASLNSVSGVPGGPLFAAGIQGNFSFVLSH